jgi:hypothetical protein
MDRIPKYNEMPAFDPDEFVTAFIWAMNAGSGRALIGDSTRLRVNLVDDDGSRVEYRVADTFMARMTIALSERYAEVDKRKYYSAAVRIFALMDLIRSGKLASWIRNTPGDADSDEISDSVIEAAAVMKLNKELQFPIREFIRKVKEIDAAKES